ncbi:hypothetical protein CapIbe_023751 [Capra ibex]
MLSVSFTARTCSFCISTRGFNVWRRHFNVWPRRAVYSPGLVNGEDILGKCIMDQLTRMSLASVISEETMNMTYQSKL